MIDTTYDGIKFRRAIVEDNPNTETHVIDASHFPLDEAPDQVRPLTMAFLGKHLAR